MARRPKYQVFISSTYSDLHEEREAVVWKVLTARHIPVGMESFTATNDRGWQTIERVLDDTDYYILIIAGKYGSVDETTDKSWTQKEYEYAISKGIPVLPFFRTDTSITADKTEEKAELRKKLAAFKKMVGDTHQRKMWSTQEELVSLVGDSLRNHIDDDLEAGRERPGWYRGTDVPSAKVVEELARLSAENAEYRTKRPDFEDIATVLANNPVRYNATFISGGGALPVETNLLTIFEALALHMKMKMSDGWAARAVTAEVTGERQLEPLETAELDRAFRQIFSDLMGYELIEVDPVRTPMGTKVAYVLSERGREFAAYLRRLELEARANSAK